MKNKEENEIFADNKELTRFKNSENKVKYKEEKEIFEETNKVALSRCRKYNQFHCIHEISLHLTLKSCLPA